MAGTVAAATVVHLAILETAAITADALRPRPATAATLPATADAAVVRMEDTVAVDIRPAAAVDIRPEAEVVAIPAAAVIRVDIAEAG